MMDQPIYYTVLRHIDVATVILKKHGSLQSVIEYTARAEEMVRGTYQLIVCKTKDQMVDTVALAIDRFESDQTVAQDTVVIPADAKPVFSGS